MATTVNKVLLISLLIFACNGNQISSVNDASHENRMIALLRTELQQERNLILVLQAALTECRNSLQAFESPETQTTIACEGSMLNIRCNNANSVLRIISANYGRTEPGSVVCPHSSIRTTQCSAASSINVLQRCQGTKTCLIQATNHVFGDPCHGTFKYLEVKYECVKS